MSEPAKELYEVHCRNCYWPLRDQDHSYATGPKAGHYCFGCEPMGVEITTVRADQQSQQQAPK